ncbi:MAG: extracellular solute-binding protein [Clostridia bacterium]|nr:extracellular solute-binding protein [Clostridia bacterium]
MKKTVLLVLIVIMCLILILSACASNDLNAENTITFSVLYNNKENSPFKEDWLILDEYFRAKNVILDVKLGYDSDFENAIELSLLSDEKPDVILKCWPDTVQSYTNEGLLLAISDYMELMPYFKAYVEKNDLEDEINQLRTENGKFYILPGYQRETQVQQWIYRKDLFDENSLKAPRTYDELYNSLRILKAKYPDTTPITASWGGAHLFSMIGAGYGIPAGWSGYQYYDFQNDKWLFAPATDQYREMYRFLNRCYEADLLDPAIFTQSDDEFLEKVKNGQALVTVTWITSGFDVWNNALKENGISNGDWTALSVMESTIGLKSLPPVSKFRKGLVITSEALEKPYFERMLTFLDWAVYSEEGRTLTYWGIEDFTYEATAEGKKFLPDILFPKNPGGTVDIAKEYGFNTIFDLNEDEEFEDYKKPDEIVAFLAQSSKNRETLPLPPLLLLSSEETEIVDIITQRLIPYVDEAGKKFITGELDIEKDWDIFLLQMSDLGYSTLEATWNNAWAR